MIYDLGQDPRDELPAYDICIVGSGPAGMSVACELAPLGQRIAVLESGGLCRTRHGDELTRVVSEGIRVKDESRERVFGGASSTWAGVAALLDPVDLEPRPFVSRSGWPIERQELMSYYREAAQRYGFPPLELFGEQGFVTLRALGPMQPAWRDLEEKVFLAPREPRHFGREHRAVFERPDVDLWLDATVITLEAEPGTRGVARAMARTSTDRTHALRARVFVLAAGGIENARLLLNSRDLCPQGLGNEHDQVGRYLMNHPKNPCGILRLARPLDSAACVWAADYQGYRGYAGVRLRPALQRTSEALNCYVHFEPVHPWPGNAGVASLAFLVGRARGFLARGRTAREAAGVDAAADAEPADPRLERSAPRAPGEPRPALALLGDVLWNLPSVALYLCFRALARRPLRVRRLRVWNFMEMAPDPDNRVLLSNQTDRNGQRVPLVRHRVTDLDRRSLLALHETLAAEVTRIGLGRLRSRLGEARPWPVDQDASHHLGTTRMGTDPRVSVVDPDCKLHGVENVFVAGGSVFPTGGCANPTFTIVALAIRLARHLEKAMRGPRAAEDRHA